MEKILNNKKTYITAIIIGALLGVAGYILPLYTFMVGVFAVLIALLVLWKTEIGVFMVAGLIPIMPTTPLLGLIGLTVLSFIIKIFLSNSYSFRITAIDGFIAAFFGILLYASITSYTMKNSVVTLSIYIACILFYFVLTNTIKDRKQLYSLAALLVVTTFIISLYGVYQYAFGGTTADAWVDTTVFTDIKSRVTATFGNPNVLGEYLVLIIPISIAMLWSKKGWFYNLCFITITALMIVCLLVTYSRGAWVGVLLTLGMFAVLRDKRLLALCIVMLLLMPFVLPTSILNRFASIGNLSDSSFAYRISIWLGSLGIIKDYWPSGIGIGSEAFKMIYPKYALAAAYAHHSHNIYLQILIETGIAGFAVFMSMIFMFYKTILYYYPRVKDKFISGFIIASGAGLLGFLVQGLVDNIWYNYRVLLAFWVIIGLGMTACRLDSAKYKEL